MIGPRRSILLLLVRERMEEDPGVHFQAWSWEESVPETVRSIYERPRAVFASTDYSSNRASTRRSSSEVTLARSYVPGDYLEQTHGTRREGGRERGGKWVLLVPSPLFDTLFFFYSYSSKPFDAEYRISETIARSVGKITPINRCFLPTMQLRRKENRMGDRWRKNLSMRSIERLAIG